MLQTAQVGPELLKASAILSDTTIRRSAVDWEDLKSYWKSEKDHISLGDQQFYYVQVFKDITNHRKKTNRVVVFNCTVDLCPTFLNTVTFDEIFQQSGKQCSFRHILKSSASMYETSSSQFFRTTSGIQLWPDAFDKSRLPS